VEDCCGCWVFPFPFSCSCGHSVGCTSHGPSRLVPTRQCMNVVPLDSIETQLLALGVPDLDHIADGVFLRAARSTVVVGGGVAGHHARRSAGSVLVQQADGTLRVVRTYGNDPPPS
jgi:hypothetical protein